MAKTGSPARWLKYVDRVIVAMNRIGMAIEHGAVLTVPGHRSGTLRQTPVSVLQLNGARHLPGGANVMLDAGVVPDTSQESFARLAGKCAVFRVDKA